MKFEDEAGNIIECTVEEYAQLKGLMTDKAEKKEVKKTVTHQAPIQQQETQTPPKKHVVFTKKELNSKYLPIAIKALDLVRTDVARNLKHALSLLAPNTTSTTYSGVSKYYRKLKQGASTTTPTEKKRRTHNLPQATRDKNRARMKYIRNRVKTMTSQDTRMSYETAFRRASEEWRLKNLTSHDKSQRLLKDDSSFKRITVKNETPFPELRPIAKSSHEYLKMLCDWMINDSKHLSLDDVENTLVLRDGSKWTQDAWENFCSSFMFASRDISEYFNVRNHFKIQNVGRGKVLRYVRGV